MKSQSKTVYVNMTECQKNTVIHRDRTYNRVDVTLKYIRLITQSRTLLFPLLGNLTECRKNAVVHRDRTYNQVDVTLNCVRIKSQSKSVTAM